MVTSIFFDLDDTLLDFGKSEAAALKRALEEFGVKPEPEILTRYHVINQTQWKRLERGEISREEVLLGRFALLLSEFGIPGDPAVLCASYERKLAMGSDVLPGAQALLQTLFPRYALYLATNGTASVQYGRLKRTGLGRYFRKVFISQELGANKPSKEFFDRCFDALPGLRREETVMVGDSLTSDILGGKNVGIRTCWYHPAGAAAPEDLRPDAEFSRLEDLPDLLKTL